MIAKQTKFEGRNIKSVETVLDESNLNFIAEKQELITASGVSVPKNVAIVRTDTNQVVGVVGNGYEPHQNSQTFGLFDTICEKFDASYQYTYEINNGSKVVIQAKVNGGFEVIPGDKVEKYITVINSFDGSTPLIAYFTTKRLWCSNQLRASLKGVTEKVSIRHTKNSESRIKEALRIFGLSLEYFKVFEEKAKVLAQKAIDKNMVEKFLNKVVGEPNSTRRKNIRSEVERLFQYGKGNNGVSGWDLYNGYSEYIDHIRGDNEEKRLASALVGSGANSKDKAFNVALNL